MKIPEGLTVSMYSSATPETLLARTLWVYEYGETALFESRRGALTPSFSTKLRSEALSEIERQKVRFSLKTANSPYPSPLTWDQVWAMLCGLSQTGWTLTVKTRSTAPLLSKAIIDYVSDEAPMFRRLFETIIQDINAQGDEPVTDREGYVRTANIPGSGAAPAYELFGHLLAKTYAGDPQLVDISIGESADPVFIVSKGRWQTSRLLTLPQMQLVQVLSNIPSLRSA